MVPSMRNWTLAGVSDPIVTVVLNVAVRMIGLVPETMGDGGAATTEPVGVACLTVWTKTGLVEPV